MEHQGPGGGFNALVPELAVFDLVESKKFWCEILGFTIAYERPENNFCYLEYEGAQVMLDQRNGNWETAPLERPLGRGVNFQIFVKDIEPLLQSIQTANWPFYKEMFEVWRRIEQIEVGSREFLLQDPDGYLLRFTQKIGKRNVANLAQER